MAEQEKLGYVGFQTTEDVLQIYRDIERLLTGGAGRQGNTPLLRIIKDNEAERLKILYENALKKEQMFYQSLGLQGDFKTLYQKTQYWSHSFGGAEQFLKNEQLIQGLKNVAIKLTQNNFDEIAISAADILTNEEWLEIVAPYIGASIDSAILENLGDSAIASKTSGTGLTKISIKANFSADKKHTYTSLNGITVHYTADGRIEIRFTKSIPSSVQKHIQDKVLKKAQEKQKTILANNRPQMEEEIMSLIDKYLPAITSKSTRIIRNIIHKYWTVDNAIQLGAGSSIIRGFLGEVYWAAFFTYIGFDAIPVGVNLKSGGTETPTDIVLKGLGFQVKNYTEMDGVVTFNQHWDRKTQEVKANQIGLYNFLTSQTKLGLSDEAAQSFGKFFFSFYYNKQNTEKDKQNKFAPMENYAMGLKQNVVSFVEANAIKLLNMDGNLELDGARALELFQLPPDFQAGKPQFYLINDLPIPASEILFDVMQSLKEINESSALINVKNVMLNIETFNPGHTWYETSGKAESIISTALGSTKKRGTASVTYSIDMNIQGLVNRILQKAKQK